MNIGRSPGNAKYQISTGKWKMKLFTHFTNYSQYILRRSIKRA